MLKQCSGDRQRDRFKQCRNRQSINRNSNVHAHLDRRTSDFLRRKDPYTAEYTLTASRKNIMRGASSPWPALMVSGNGARSSHVSGKEVRAKEHAMGRTMLELRFINSCRNSFSDVGIRKKGSPGQHQGRHMTAFKER